MKRALKKVNVEFEIAQLQEMRTMGLTSGRLRDYFEERLKRIKRLKELNAELIFDIYYSFCLLTQKCENFIQAPHNIKETMERCKILIKQRVEFIFYFKKPKQFSWSNFDGVLLFNGTLFIKGSL